MTAAADGETERVDRMIHLKQDIWCNYNDGSKWAPLTYAASFFEYGDVELIQMMIRGGCNVNAVDEMGWSVLDFAKHEAEHCTYSTVPAKYYPKSKITVIKRIFQTLIDAGADTEFQSGGFTSLMFLVIFARKHCDPVEICRVLCSAGAV